MAEKKKTKQSRKLAEAKPNKPTVRQLTKSSNGAKKPRRIKRAGSKVASLLSKLFWPIKKLFGWIKIPDNKVSRFISKRFGFIPRYFREAWKEIKLTTWPTRKETYRLTGAVLIFSIVFAAVVSLLDYGLDKIFKEFILK